VTDERRHATTGSVGAIAFTAALLAGTIALLFATGDLQPSAAVVPRIVAIPVALLLCYRLTRELLARARAATDRAGAGSRTAGEVGGPAVDVALSQSGGRAGQGTVEATGSRTDEGTRGVAAVVWLLALPAAATALGFIAGPAVWVVAWLRFRAHERLAVTLAAGAVAAVAIPGLFTGLLGVHLPTGLLGWFI
jgi:hypothetical protein